VGALQSLWRVVQLSHQVSESSRTRSLGHTTRVTFLRGRWACEPLASTAQRRTVVLRMKPTGCERIRVGPTPTVETATHKHAAGGAHWGDTCGVRVCSGETVRRHATRGRTAVRVARQVAPGDGGGGGLGQQARMDGACAPRCTCRLPP
jgi:hypothetical protein